MAIIKHIAVHQLPLKLIRYILNGNKTDEMKYATGLCCNADVKAAYMEMCANFEGYSGERFYKKSLDRDTAKKEKIRLHHYIQSFKPNEVTPEEAHKIGVEWTRKVFGENHQVIVTTHVDRLHIHNHFAVAAYDLDGKAWYDNKTTLKRCRDISDKICKAHGLSIIENPKYNANHKYGDWIARKNGTSWKQRLCDDIDKLILHDDVQSVQDLSERLREKGYVVTLGKYLSVKAVKNRKAVRTLRLGDGYGIEELQYRIENKNREMSLQTVAGYQGIQREYALCLRELQITVYRRPENSYSATYSELRKNAEMLTYLCDNNIRSVGDFENLVNAAAEKADSLKKEREKLLQSIEEKEKVLQDGARYLDLVRIKIPTAEQLDELDKLSCMTKYRLRSDADIDVFRQEIADLKNELAETEKNIETAEKEKSEAGRNYQTYLRQMQSDYDLILDKLRREQEEIRKTEQEQQREQEQERQTRTNNNRYI